MVSQSSSGPGSAAPPLDFSVLDRTCLDPYYLHEHDADVQALFSAWSVTRPAPPTYKPARLAGGSAVALAVARDAWTTKAAAAWVLARQLGDHGFERYALAQLIQNCAVALFGPWAFIEARCPDRWSIRRFTNHWVAWNASLAGTGSQSEFSGLYATTLLGQVVRGDTHDPRTFNLDHWFSDCGDDLTAKCNRNPIVRRAREWENSQPERPKAPQLGRTYEMNRQSQRAAAALGNVSSTWVNSAPVQTSR